jgi:hypothetical protein
MFFVSTELVDEREVAWVKGGIELPWLELVLRLVVVILLAVVLLLVGCELLGMDAAHSLMLEEKSPNFLLLEVVESLRK